MEKKRIPQSEVEILIEELKGKGHRIVSVDVNSDNFMEMVVSYSPAV